MSFGPAKVASDLIHVLVSLPTASLATSHLLHPADALLVSQPGCCRRHDLKPLPYLLDFHLDQFLLSDLQQFPQKQQSAVQV